MRPVLSRISPLAELLASPDSASVYKSGPATLAFLAVEALSRGQSAVVVAPGVNELSRIAALLELLAPASPGTLWGAPFMSLPSYAPGRPSGAFWARRMAFLAFAAMGRGPRILLLTADNLLPKWPPPKALEGNILTVAVGEELPRDLIAEQAVLWGYKRAPMVTNPGEFSLRGDILDIFPPGYESPLRLEFFGDMVEAVRRFDAGSQRSLAELTEATLLPAAPAVLSETFMDEARSLWEAIAGTGELHRAAKQHLENALDVRDGAIWPGLFYERPVELSAWFPADAAWIVCDATRVKERLEEAEHAWRHFFETETREQGHPWPTARVLWPENMARKALVSGRRILFEDLVMGRGRHGPDLPEKPLEHFGDLFWKPGSDKRPWTTLTAALKEWSRQGQTILSFHGERSRKKFLQMIEPEGLVFRTRYLPDESGLFALLSPLRHGMELSWRDTRVLAEDVLHPESAKAGAEVDRGKDFKGLTSFDDIRPGDLVVHRDYGVASFEGLTRMTVDATGGDYLLLVFADDDKLYLPADRLGLLQRYKGPEGIAPPLDRLGGVRWKSVRERAKKAIERIAADLVEMYAYRQVAKGYAYGPTNELYLEFEATFGFEETPDQERAIGEVLADMERPEPMDRLVCGDVGFGKTEVALRAAFRAVLDGKQVAMLCPTTVLAEQHFQNFAARLEGFPVRVEMLSRFVTPKRRKVVLEAVSRGQVDILIGTHRILSADVAIPNIGLLILDEEQRFGVKHKERLKAFKKNIDALTLTATPIPRTLQLSLSGVRGLSVIETPPLERKTVETALVERDEAFLREVLRRELERQGQVFWVHNRVQGLEDVAAFVKTLAPGAKVAMAHGQMSETALEEAMHGFWHGETDILVCTSIIESGLDFPRANTLIVDNAHMFGLGQLYQLRGRVGRSPRQAYAYFVVPSIEKVPELARKRLRVILDMDYLGAGFQVAMEDLRLRGAGNILGEAQSGHIARIGLDMFLEMLAEEVRRLKGEPIRERTEPELVLGVAARIPERYVPETSDRLRLYKALSTARTEQGLAEIMAEVRDRFGPPPPELENFRAILALKQVLSRLGGNKAEIAPSRLVISFEAEVAAVSPERLVAFVGARGDGVRLLPPGKLALPLDQNLPLPEAVAVWARELAALGEETS
jgi:transcription-repair coupling factor (superfamily II helicase)